MKALTASIILVVAGTSASAALADPQVTTTTQQAREAMERQHATGTTNKDEAGALAKQQKADDFTPPASGTTEAKEPTASGTTEAKEPPSDPEADRRDSTTQRPE
jgi:hypothetical protein